jgi:hypothetical protein
MTSEFTNKVVQLPWQAIKSELLGDWRWRIVVADDHDLVVAVGVTSSGLASRIAELHNEDLEKL